MYALVYFLAPLLYWGAAIILVLSVVWLGGKLGLKRRGKTVVGGIVLLLFAFPFLHKLAGIGYMNYLCEKDGGEHIYKTVENVDGIYQMTPQEYIERMHPKDVPAGYDPIKDWGQWQDAVFFVHPRSSLINYQFYERPLKVTNIVTKDNYKFVRHTRQEWVGSYKLNGTYDQKLFQDDAKPKEERITALKSHYGLCFAVSNEHLTNRSIFKEQSGSS